MCDDPNHTELLLTRGRLGAQALAIDNGDQLYLYCRNTAVSSRVQIDYELYIPGQGIIHGAEGLIPTTNRNLSTLTVTLARGYLVGLNVTATAGSAFSGETFAAVQLIRVNAALNFGTLQLVQGWVTVDSTLCWPTSPLAGPGTGPGNPRSITGTDRAAGAEISELVPDSCRWELLGMRAQLVAAAQAATRRVHLKIADGDQVTLLQWAAADTQLISATRNYNFSADGFARAAADSEIYVPIPSGLVLRGGWYIKTLTTALDAGDNWGAPQLWVKEWIEE